MPPSIHRVAALTLSAVGVALLAACPGPPGQGAGEPSTPAPAPVAPGADAPVPEPEQGGDGADETERAPDDGTGRAPGDEPEAPDEGTPEPGERPSPTPEPPGPIGPRAGGPPPDLPDAWTACGSDADCVGVELECCDHCNGGTLVAVHRDHAEATRKRYGPGSGPGACRGVACTMRACFGPDPACEQGRCTLVQAQGPAIRRSP